jgi:hypothetical protein
MQILNKNLAVDMDFEAAFAFDDDGLVKWTANISRNSAFAAVGTTYSKDFCGSISEYLAIATTRSYRAERGQSCRC